MKTILRWFLLFAALAAPAWAQRDIGYVEVVAEKNTIPIRVSASTAELNDLALRAFGAHGG